MFPHSEKVRTDSWRWLPWLSVFLALGALLFIYREVRLSQTGSFIESFQDLPLRKVALATFLTPIAYLLLTGYDWIALRYVQAQIPLKRVLFAAFVGYAFSNAISMTPSMAIRYRIYSRWGLNPKRIVQVFFFHYVSTWIGFLAIGGVLLLVDVGPLPKAYPWITDYRHWFGVALLLLIGAYLWFSSRGGFSLRIRQWTLPFPPPSIAIPQSLLSLADWGLMGMIPYLLLPVDGSISYLGFVSLFLLAQLTQILSHVPGGIGVFDGVLVFLLKPYAPASQVVAALIVYRIVFMLIPLAMASFILLIYEFRVHRSPTER